MYILLKLLKTTFVRIVFYTFRTINPFAKMSQFYNPAKPEKENKRQQNPVFIQKFKNNFSVNLLKIIA